MRTLLVTVLGAAIPLLAVDFDSTSATWTSTPIGAPALPDEPTFYRMARIATDDSRTVEAAYAVRGDATTVTWNATPVQVIALAERGGRQGDLWWAKGTDGAIYRLSDGSGPLATAELWIPAVPVAGMTWSGTDISFTVVSLSATAPDARLSGCLHIRATRTNGLITDAWWKPKAIGPVQWIENQAGVRTTGYRVPGRSLPGDSPLVGTWLTESAPDLDDVGSGFFELLHLGADGTWLSYRREAADATEATEVGTWTPATGGLSTVRTAATGVSPTQAATVAWNATLGTGTLVLTDPATSLTRTFVRTTDSGSTGTWLGGYPGGASVLTGSSIGHPSLLVRHGGEFAHLTHQGLEWGTASDDGTTLTCSVAGDLNGAGGLSTAAPSVVALPLTGGVPTLAGGPATRPDLSITIIPQITFLDPEFMIYPGGSAYLRVTIDPPLATAVPVPLTVTGSASGVTVPPLLFLPAGATSVQIPITVAANATGTATIAFADEILPYLDSDQITALDLQVPSTTTTPEGFLTGDGETVLSLADADLLSKDILDGLAPAVGPQDINLVALDGRGPYAVTVSPAGAAVVRPWRPAAAAVDWDGDNDADAAQVFTIVPVQTGSITLTLTDADGRTTTRTITATAGTASSATVPVPDAAVQESIYTLGGIASVAGGQALMARFQAADRDPLVRRGFAYNARTATWSELPVAQDTILPWDAYYLADRTGADLAFAVELLPQLPYIPLYPGWNALSLPPIQGLMGTDLPASDLAVYEEFGTRVDDTFKARVIGSPITWNGSAFETLTTLRVGQGFFLKNNLASARMLYLVPGQITTGRTRSTSSGDPRARWSTTSTSTPATGVMGTPPAPPASATRAETNGSGCGAGLAVLTLSGGLFLVLRRRRG